MRSPVIELERIPMDRGQKFDRHRHEGEHQLMWASSGVIMVGIEDRYWVLPTSLALWVPAGTWHMAKALQRSSFEGIYLDPTEAPVGWTEPTVVTVSPLAARLIEHLAGELESSARVHAETVLLDVLRPVEKAPVELPLPCDDRARALAEILLANPADQRSLRELSRHAGSSPRTLLRIFLAETGLTFSQWRTQARLQAAMALLAEGLSVATVANRVGYATASAFVVAFRRITGHTPSAYFTSAA